MTALGDIKLHFGETGDEDESPLEFVAGHINLIVGPNNAGKSLFLRELSGQDPRGRNRGWQWRPHETRIVSAADWSEAHRDELRQHVIAEALRDKPMSLIQERAWPRLLQALERVPAGLLALRHTFSEAVGPIIAPLLTEFLEEWGELVRLWGNEIELDKRDQLTSLAGVALLAYLNHERSQRADAEEEGADDEEALATRPLSKVHGQLREAAQGFWTQSCELFGELGISTEATRVDEILDGPTLLRLIAEYGRREPMLFALVPASFRAKLPTDEPLEAGAFERFEIVEKLGGWMFDPSPLSELGEELEATYRDHTWQDPEFWAGLAEHVLYLDGLERLLMTQSAVLRPFAKSTDDAPPILALLKDGPKREALRALVADALGAHLVIDMNSAAPNVLWCLASEPPEPGIETTYSEASNAYFSAAAPLVEKSDGIHAFVGMLASVIARGCELIFIDEPEAFLHPPLVRKLARQLAALAREHDVQFFIATHSPEMLASVAMGGVNVNVLRLTYRDDLATARLLDSATLRKLALDPLMRSESALSALFHDGAVVCEAAADRVLYQEVNERLLTCDPEGPSGVESCVFVNAQNWQTVANIVAPLRRVGVAAAALIDADALFGKELPQLLASAQMSPARQRSVRETRDLLKASIEDRMASDAKFTFKRKTIAGLTRKERQDFEEVLEDCARYGVFFVPVGELEDWLQPIGLKPSTQKSHWFRKALDRLGRDPEASDYIRPRAGDIWDFMRGVASWINNPRRRGTAPTDART